MTQALHGTRHSNVRPELRREILQAARRLGYQPQNVTTHTIGLVMPTETLVLAGEARLVVQMDEAARRAGYRLALATAHKGDLEELRDNLSPKKVDGVIFHRWFNGQIQNLLSPEVPWVLTSDEDGVSAAVDVVTVDTIQSVELLTQYLLEQGHRRFCLVTGMAGSGFHERQAAGLRMALGQASFPENSFSTIEVLYDRDIPAQLRKIMADPNPPTAIIAGSPEKTVCVMNLLYHDGYRIPEDVSVVSLMDSALLQPLLPPVTTTSFGDGVADLAVARLLEKIATPDSPAKQLLVPSELVLRESVAPVH